MTKPRTLEEIAEEWLRIGPLADADYTGLPDEVYASLLAALREAADTAHEAGLKLGTTLQAEAIEQARQEEREALRAKAEEMTCDCDEYGRGTPCSPCKFRSWLDARSRPEEPKV